MYRSLPPATQIFQQSEGKTANILKGKQQLSVRNEKEKLMLRLLELYAYLYRHESNTFEDLGNT